MAKVKTEEEMIQWFENDVLPQLITENRFPIPDVKPENLEKIGIKWEITERNSDHFASRPYFTTLILSDKTNKGLKMDFQLLIKFIPQEIAVRQSMDVDNQFYNEMVFYTEVLPKLKEYALSSPNVPSTYFDDLCPECYYAHIDMEKPEDAIIILEDLRPKGYKPAEEKVYLDHDHFKVAYKQLGKFHAVSFAMKEEKPDEFKLLATSFIECRYPDNRYQKESMGYFYEKSGVRAIDYLLAQENTEISKDFLECLRKQFTSDIYERLQNYVAPKEPLSVIVHGDFCRNNILFHFTDGKPDNCILFDFATYRYSSPTIDLSFSLFLNSDLELREKYFDDLLKIYYTSLLENTAVILNKSFEELSALHPFESFLVDFFYNSVYGYAVISFFLPCMLYPDESGDIIENFETLTFQEMAENNAKLGGEEGTKKIADVLLSMYKLRNTVKQIELSDHTSSASSADKV